MSKKFVTSIQPLVPDTKYYAPSIADPSKTLALRWINCEDDYIKLHRCLVFVSEKHAKRAANMLLKHIKLNKETMESIIHEPQQGQIVYISNPLNFPSVVHLPYRKNDSIHRMLWQRGLLYKTKDAAYTATLMLLMTLYSQTTVWIANSDHE